MDIQPSLGATRRLIPDLLRLLPGAEIALASDGPGCDELHVRPANALGEATVRVMPEGARVERVMSAGPGLDESMFLGARRRPTDLQGLVSDIASASAAEAAFDGTEEIRLAVEAAFPEGAACLAPPDPALPFDVLVLTHEGEPTGVEVIVADTGAWLRVDGEDGPGHELDEPEALAESAAEAARSRSCGAAPRC